MIGKIRRSLKERCPECGRILQIRIVDEQTLENGVWVSLSKEYISCSDIKNCGYTRTIEQKRRRKKEELII